MAGIKDGTIGFRDTMILLVTVLTCKIFLTTPRTMVQAGLNAAWMLPWLHLLVLLVTFLPALFLMQRYPRLNLVEVAERLGGAVTGIVVSLVLALYFLFNGTIIMRQFTEIVVTALLPKTPLSIITVTFILAVAYGVYHGIESIARKTTVLVHFILFSLVGLLVLSLNKAHFSYIFPFWGPGFPGLLKGGAFSNTVIMLMPILNPYFRERSKLSALIIGSSMISTLFFSITTAVYVMVFDVNSAISGGAFPLFNMARMLNFGRFIQRLESVFILIWVLVLLASVSVLIYGSAVSLATGLRLPCYRPLLFPLLILVYSINFMVPNFPTAVELDTLIISRAWWIVAVPIPTILWLISLVKEKGGLKREQNQQEDS